MQGFICEVCLEEFDLIASQKMANGEYRTVVEHSDKTCLLDEDE